MGNERKSTLVVDAGSTKASWGLPGVGEKCVTKGINALTSVDSDVNASLKEAHEKVGYGSIREIYWYGAGCATEASCHRIQQALENEFEPESVWVGSDLVGAARALFGSGSGIASILGTGSNSGFFNGREISAQVPSLGYILGDEGSGVAIGKRLMARVLRGVFPKNLSEELSEQRGVDIVTVLERVYRSGTPNSYLASFMPFLADHEEDAAVKELICEEFGCFAERILTAYPKVHEVPLGFVGSIAWRFRTLLEKTLESYGLRAEKIIKDPMEGLLKYHA